MIRLRFKTLALLLTLLSLQPLAYAEQTKNLDISALLKLVAKGQARDNSEFEKRMQLFVNDKNKQQQLLAEANKERARLEKLSAEKEQKFAEQEDRLQDEQARLRERLGSLKELFGVLQQVAGDTQGIFEGSVISAQLPNRSEFLTQLIQKAGSSSKLPSIKELERLWFEMQREMTYSGQIAAFTAQVILPNGQQTEQNVVRVGSFNAVSGGKYLHYDIEAKQLVQLANQPSGRFTGSIDDLENAKKGLNDFWVDPARGQLLLIMGQSASVMDRVKQGGIVGYIIIVLGALGIVLAIWRMLVLSLHSKRIHAQMQNDEASDDNALGRVMKVYQKHQTADIETLELHLAEAIANEVPKLSKGINWIKIISVVAPLLGLLGTVTGMIDVFETMSLFGTGDPKLMAGGISQALVTTVLGLVAAIPCVFLHTLSNNRSRHLIMLLEERATGILARQSQANAKG